MSSELRIFFGHAKAETDEQIDADVAEIVRRVQAKMPGTTPHVVAGRDDFARHVAAAGGWDKWIPRWATGFDLDGQARYDWIIVPDALGSPRCGKATGQGVAMALLGGKTVIYWDRTAGSWSQVEQIEHVEPRNFQTGWKLILAR